MSFRKYYKHEIDNVVFEIKLKKACVLPTDTIIGIAALDDNLIYKIKQRPKHKKIIILVPNLAYLGKLNNRQTDFLKQFWPGKVSIIHNNIAYRMPNDPWLLLLLSKTGPLYCSSANISNCEVIQDTEEVNDIFDKKFQFDLVYVEGKQNTNQPSTIVDIDNWTILREGCMIKEIKEYLEKKIN